MRISCGVIRDLLPLYAEGMACKETEELVNEHMEHCADCRQALEAMRTPADFCCEEDLGAIKEVKSQLHKRRVMTGILALLLTATVLMGGFFYLTMPEYLSAQDAVEQVYTGGENELYIRFTGAVDHYEAVYSRQPEDGQSSEGGVRTLTILGWRYKWRSLFGMSEEVNREVPITLTAQQCQVWYSSTGEGEDDTLLWEEDGREAWGENRRTLPKLVMSYYFWLAMIAAILLTVTSVFLRGKKAGRWLAIGAVFFWSFDAAALISGGGSLVSYTAVRHFICTMILTALLTASTAVLWKVMKINKQ